MVPVKRAVELGELGRVYNMPDDAGQWNESESTAWSVGLFAGAGGIDTVETKRIVTQERHKRLTQLEIHQHTPQVYAVLQGSVAVPVSADLDAASVALYQVDAGQAIVVNAKVWHAGAVAVDGPALVVVVLRKGTTELDTTKSPIDREIEL